MEQDVVSKQKQIVIENVRGVFEVQTCQIPDSHVDW
jgi:hypothetical protein